MKPSEMLSSEHNELGRALRLLRIEAMRIEQGKEHDPAIVAELVHFLRDFGDHCHHAKEEAVIFPAVERSGGELGEKLVLLLVTEHKIGRELLQKISEANTAYEHGQREYSKRLAHSAVEYVTHMAGHMRAENLTLLEFMDHVFSVEEGEQLYRQCAVIETEAPLNHEALEEALEDLESRFAA